MVELTEFQMLLVALVCVISGFTFAVYKADVAARASSPDGGWIALSIVYGLATVVMTVGAISAYIGPSEPEYFKVEYRQTENETIIVSVESSERIKDIPADRLKILTSGIKQ